MPAGNAIYGSHDGLGLSMLGHESAVSAICGDEDGQHVKTWRLGSMPLQEADDLVHLRVVSY